MMIVCKFFEKKIQFCKENLYLFATGMDGTKLLNENKLGWYKILKSHLSDKCGKY